MSQALLSMVMSENPEQAPSVTWFKTRKGRGYLKYDNASHGAPHPLNSALFWDTKREFAERVWRLSLPISAARRRKTRQPCRLNFPLTCRPSSRVLGRDQALVDYLADRLVAWGRACRKICQPASNLTKRGNPFKDERLYDFRSYPQDLYAKPGEMVANRAALAKWGAWANALGAPRYGRPLFLACSADLADSTNISGFGKAYGDFPGYGWYERCDNQQGVVLPQEITEFANAGILAGHGSRQLLRAPGTGIRRLLGRLFHLRILLLSEVRHVPPVQPDGPGLPVEARQGAVGRRAFRARKRPTTAAPTSAFSSRA